MLFEDTYLAITSPSEGVFKDRGSKFIAYAFPVSTEDEIKKHVLSLKKEHHSAKHHCFAYRLGADKLIFRVNDDGEPSNTAGKPILGQIQSRDLTNVLVVVVRYFGGTLLGVAGLINAYRSAAADVLNNATVIEKTVNDFYEIEFEYIAMNEVMKIVKDEKIEIEEQKFEEKSCLLISVRKNNSDKVYNMLSKIPNLEIKFIRSR